MERLKEGSRNLTALSELFETYWFVLLVGGAAALLVLATIGRFVFEPYYVTDDSALFQHAGWYITQGATPDVDFWDLKPPLIYAITTVLAVISGGNMVLLHLLSVLVSILAVVGGVALVGLLAYRLTSDELASFTAGGTMFVVPSVYTLPSSGIRPKYFAFLFGVMALLLAVEDRPGWSGVAAAVGTGFWQLCAPLAVVVVAIAWRRSGGRGAGRAVVGGAIVAVVVVAPFVVAGLTVPLFLETVLAPVYGVERYTVVGRLLVLVVELGYGTLLIPLGVAGWGMAAVRDVEGAWWLSVGGGLYLLQPFLELQGAIEMILPILFLALGVGVVVAETSQPSRRALLVGGIGLLAVLNFYWLAGPATPVKASSQEERDERTISDYEALPEKPDDVPTMQTIYWEQRRPDICHYRLGQKQRWYTIRTGGSLERRTCGRWPFDDPPRGWLLS